MESKIIMINQLMTHVDYLVEIDNDNHVVNSQYHRAKNLVTIIQQLKTINQWKEWHKDEMNEGTLVLDKQFDRIDKSIEVKKK